MVKIALAKHGRPTLLTTLSPFHGPHMWGLGSIPHFPLHYLTCATCLKKRNTILQRIAFTRWYRDWKCMFYNMHALKKSFPFSLFFLDILIIHSKISNTLYTVFCYSYHIISLLLNYRNGVNIK